MIHMAPASRLPKAASVPESARVSRESRCVRYRTPGQYYDRLARVVSPGQPGTALNTMHLHADTAYLQHQLSSWLVLLP